MQFYYHFCCYLHFIADLSTIFLQMAPSDDALFWILRNLQKWLFIWVQRTENIICFFVIDTQNGKSSTDGKAQCESEPQGLTIPKSLDSLFVFFDESFSILCLPIPNMIYSSTELFHFSVINRVIYIKGSFSSQLLYS